MASTESNGFLKLWWPIKVLIRCCKYSLPFVLSRLLKLTCLASASIEVNFLSTVYITLIVLFVIRSKCFCICGN